MNRIFKFLEMAGAAIIVLTLLGVGFYIMNQGKDVIEETGKKGIESILAYQDSEVTDYDGKLVTGYEVIRFIKKLSDEKEEIGVRVYTGASGSLFRDYVRGIVTANGAVFNITGITDTADAEKYDETLSKTDINYINPGGSFKGEVYRNENDVIMAVVFRQQ